MKQITFEVIYHRQPENYSVQETWTKTEYYCPRCGEQKVYVSDLYGNYYSGRSHICGGCSGFFNFNGVQNPDPEDREDKQRFAEITLEEKK
jgi:predicted RNA-binding Zn-ribbon protein involved in translation (DUF1610 family)